MGVPAHDERDAKFGANYSIPFKTVVEPDSDLGSDLEESPEGRCYTGKEGTLICSGVHTGLKIVEAQDAIVRDLEAMGLGEGVTRHRLRDWLVSR